MLADKAYDAGWIRDHIERQGVTVLYGERNRIERHFNRCPPQRHPLQQGRRSPLFKSGYALLSPWPRW